MKRKYLADLERWLTAPDRKPLMVWGARQVGKSYLIEELFAKKYFPNRYLRIDCSDDTTFVNYVFSNGKLNDVLAYIELAYGFKADENHLLIFDEAQDCLPVVKMMKHFCEQHREIPVIATGSLVRLKIMRDAHKRGQYAKDTKFLFPVGKINQLYIYPMTFDEFLLNDNPGLLDYLSAHFQKQIPLEPVIHQKALDALQNYLFVGGMPEVVDTYLKNKGNGPLGLQAVVDKLQEIYDDYLADMDLYQASPESIIRSRAVYRDIYRQLNKENKNFKFSLVEEKAKRRDMANPIAWLVTAKVVNQSFLLKEKVTTPFVKEEDSLTRLYLSDMGMFTYQSGLNVKTFLTNKNNALSGIYFENYVACELSARRIGLFYWKGKRDSEMEFLLDIDGHPTPIDVKKGRSSLNSLKEFRAHNSNGLAIKISSNQYGYDQETNLLTLPLYYLSFYLDKLQKGAINKAE